MVLQLCGASAAGVRARAGAAGAQPVSRQPAAVYPGGRIRLSVHEFRGTAPKRRVVAARGESHLPARHLTPSVGWRRAPPRSFTVSMAAHGAALRPRLHFAAQSLIAVFHPLFELSPHSRVAPLPLLDGSVA